MTYGWAILIIAIVIVAIFQLNLFNPYTFAPRASPGSCQIMRPNGPGSNLFVSAVGPACTINEIPQYVIQFGGASNSRIEANVVGSTSSITVTFWFFIPTWANTTSLYPQLFQNGNLGSSPNALVYFAMSSNIPTGRGTWRIDGNNAPNFGYHLGVWEFFSGTFNGIAAIPYIDAVAQPSALQSGAIGPYDTIILGAGGGSDVLTFGGSRLSNVQIYNTSLSQPEIQALYQEGIGGAPTNIQNLVGWWPLNGNTKDYSGNNNNGVPTNVIYTSSWTSGYTTP